MAPGYRSADVTSYSETVIGWLLDPIPSPLEGQSLSWEAAACEAARWAIQVHGIGPLLDWALERRPDPSLHPSLREYLANQRRLSRERVALLLHELVEILDACRDAGISVLPLKGSLLATQYYPEPGLRPMADLDLLVRPDDEARMLQVLARLRYQRPVRSWKHLTLARPEGRGPVVSWEGDHPANPRSLDLHIRLAEQFWGIHYDLTEEAWANTEPGRLLGIETDLLRPVVLLHHLIIHATSDMIARRVRLLHLHDIALVAREMDTASWEHIVAGARARREERLVYPALALTSRYYSVVPEAVLAELRAGVPGALLNYLALNGLDQLSFCNSAPTSIGEKLCWFRPGRERAIALRHILFPDPSEIANWYPRLARFRLLPLAYARYGAELLGWAARRALGMRRLKLVASGKGNRRVN